MARKPRTIRKSAVEVWHKRVEIVRGRESLCFADIAGITCYEIATHMCDTCSYSACENHYGNHTPEGMHIPIQEQVRRVSSGCWVRDIEQIEHNVNARFGILCRQDTTHGVDCYEIITHICDNCSFRACAVCTTLWHGMAGKSEGVIGYDKRDPEAGRYELKSEKADEIMREKRIESDAARSKMLSETDDLLERARAGKL